MEEYTRKHLSESVYPFVYVPQKNPTHFCIKEESGKERSQSALKVKGGVLFPYFLHREDFTWAKSVETGRSLNSKYSLPGQRRYTSPT